MANFRRYTSVPPNSTVEVEVTPCGGTATTKAKLISSTDVLTWNPCGEDPPPHVLGAGRNYFVSVRLFFIAQGTETVKITVRGPDGQAHSTPWRWTINGNPGDIALVGGFIEVA